MQSKLLIITIAILIGVNVLLTIYQTWAGVPGAVSGVQASCAATTQQCLAALNHTTSGGVPVV